MEEITHPQDSGKNKVWPIILFNIILTNEQLVEELKTKTPEDREKIFAEFQKNDKENSWTKEEKQTEQEAKFAALRPVGLTHAPQDTQDYRKKLEDKAMKWDKNALNEMEFFQWKFAYNIDWTVKLLKLEWGKTFCADLTGNWWTRNWTDAKQLAESKWYHLLTDWNKSDKQEDKADTDRYKLEQYFGEYAHMWSITYMLGCIPGRYWTGTEYKNEDWSIRKGVARYRMLYKYHCIRCWYNTYYNYRVCGFKDSM